MMGRMDKALGGRIGRLCCEKAQQTPSSCESLLAFGAQVKRGFADFGSARSALDFGAIKSSPPTLAPLPTQFIQV